MMMETSATQKCRVVFVCVHNSCRSQIAEALGIHFASDIFQSYSAGTDVKPNINPVAVRLVKEQYNIDMEKTQYSKLLFAIPPVDVLVTMGCNVICPHLPCTYKEDWGIDDPTGNDDEYYIQVIKRIEEKIFDLALRIKNGNIKVSL